MLGWVVFWDTLSMWASFSHFTSSKKIQLLIIPNRLEHHELFSVNLQGLGLTGTIILWDSPHPHWQQFTNKGFAKELCFSYILQSLHPVKDSDPHTSLSQETSSLFLHSHILLLTLPVLFEYVIVLSLDWSNTWYWSQTDMQWEANYSTENIYDPEQVTEQFWIPSAKQSQ